MADILRLTPEEIRTQAGIFTNGSETIAQEIMDEMRSLISEMEQGWSGSACIAFCEIMKSDGKDALRRMSELCFDTSEELNTIANTIEELDLDIGDSYSGN